MITLSQNKKLRVISLFSGCGGLDIPFSTDQYHISCAYDNDPTAIQCLKYNLKCDAKVFDVLDPTFEAEMQRQNHADIVLGGFPCQGFSKSGPKKQNDPRNKLYKSMLRAVEILRPKVFVAENVDGMVQNFEGSYVNKIVNDFHEIGYNVEYRILNAVNYGVSQYRRRIVFIGTESFNNKKFMWPEPTHEGISRNGEFKTKWDVQGCATLFEDKRILPSRTIQDAIGDLMDLVNSFPDNIHLPIANEDYLIMNKINEGQKLCNVRFSSTSVYTWNIPEVFGIITKTEKIILETIGKNRRKKIYGSIPNGNPLSIEDIKKLTKLEMSEEDLNKLIKQGYLKLVDGKYDLKGAMFCSGLYKRPNWHEPSPTVLTVFDNPRYFFHPKRTRPFTVRECARLQSFPDTFKFIEAGIKIKDAYRLIGNAVPPELAKAIESSIFKYITQ